MKRKLFGLLAGVALLATGLAPTGALTASAGPGPDGITSDDVEFVAHVPFEEGTATGANFFSKGKKDYMIITGWKTFSIFDITDPLSPARTTDAPIPFGFKFENEDVATNGKIMLFSESTPGNSLHIWDIEDVTNPVNIASLEGAGNHTTSCILKCKYAYGSDGTISDLRDPANPVLMEETWGENTPAGNNGHDVTEVANGLVLTSTNPMMLLDARKDPLHPKVLAVSEQMPAFVHSNIWPRKGTDRWALSTGETWVPGADARCSDQKAGLSTHDTTNWKKTHSFKLVDTFRMKNGTYTDGNPAINAPFGCSSHWFTTHPKWNNGGLVAAGFYNHGTRFLKVDSKGKITEVGFFLPAAGGTSGAYWVTDEIVYAVDYQRGFDILKWNGKV